VTRRAVRIVQWPGPPLRWAPLSILHGCPVEYDSTPEAIVGRVVLHDAPIDAPVRKMSREQLEADVLALVARTLGREVERVL
jgi:hypothetical protein